MFEINRYIYVSKKTHSRHEIYARNVELADSLAQRITNLGVFNLRRAKIRFCRRMKTDLEPYLIEQEQIWTIEEWEKGT